MILSAFYDPGLFQDSLKDYFDFSRSVRDGPSGFYLEPKHFYEDLVFNCRDLSVDSEAHVKLYILKKKWFLRDPSKDSFNGVFYDVSQQL